MGCTKEEWKELKGKELDGQIVFLVNKMSSNKDMINILCNKVALLEEKLGKHAVPTEYCPHTGN